MAWRYRNNPLYRSLPAAVFHCSLPCSKLIRCIICITDKIRLYLSIIPELHLRPREITNRFLPHVQRISFSLPHMAHNIQCLALRFRYKAQIRNIHAKLPGNIVKQPGRLCRAALRVSPKRKLIPVCFFRCLVVQPPFKPLLRRAGKFQNRQANRACPPACGQTCADTAP